MRVCAWECVRTNTSMVLSILAIWSSTLALPSATEISISESCAIYPTALWVLERMPRVLALRHASAYSHRVRTLGYSVPWGRFLRGEFGRCLGQARLARVDDQPQHIAEPLLHLRRQAMRARECAQPPLR